MISIGIDPGTHTGVAVWDGEQKKFVFMGTLLIHQAMVIVTQFLSWHKGDIEVVFEDARQRTWYGKGDISGKIQGAGSIKRDCSIWEDFLKDSPIPYKALPPIKGATKVSAEYFKAISGWKGKTSEHSRDAAMLVIGR